MSAPPASRPSSELKPLPAAVLRGAVYFSFPPVSAGFAGVRPTFRVLTSGETGFLGAGAIFFERSSCEQPLVGAEAPSNRCPPGSGLFFISSGERRLCRRSPHIPSAHLRGDGLPLRWENFFERSSDECALAGAEAPSGRPPSSGKAHAANISYEIISIIFMLSSHSRSIVGSQHSCWG